MAQTIQYVQAGTRPSFVRLAAPIVLFPFMTFAAWSMTAGPTFDEVSPVPVPAGRSVDAAERAPAFMSYAVARVPETLHVTASPAGRTIVAELAADSRISVGGRVSVPAGFGEVESLWVAAETPEGEVYGFVPRSSVELIAGDPPPLDIGGFETARLLAPVDGVRGVDLTGAPAAKATVPDVIEISWLPATVQRWEELLIEAGRQHKVDPALLAIVMLVESGGNPNARSSAGATGLMQVMPATARGIAAERGITDFSVDQLYEPEVSIDFGAYYLAQQLRSFGRVDDPDWAESVRNAAVAYNGGPGAAQRFVKGSSIAAETRSYHNWVGGMWSERGGAGSTTFERWMAAGGARLVAAAEAG